MHIIVYWMGPKTVHVEFLAMSCVGFVSSVFYIDHDIILTGSSVDT